ncbi:MAG TPA: DUF1993 domain-containing protein [Bdellovibrionales bacterium]|nr:DUF1993 domain-containing protein [Bdellovibrionales bacterium]
MMYESTVPQCMNMLRALKTFLAKGAAAAETKKFDFDVLLNARLAPDQFPLIRQVQIATDTAKIGVSRLTGKDALTHDDKEKTLPELNQRIDEVIGYLSSITAKDFEGAEQKKITTPRWEAKWLAGADYVNQYLLPNLYFHVTTAYSILRHNGVDVGKKDYLGEISFKK